MPYLLNTPEDREAMLAKIGVATVDDLFAPIPSELRLKRPLDIPPALPEMELARHMNALAAKNRAAGDAICFLGGGAYDHFIPSVVDAIAGRSEFYTAYTPYQAEASQGSLQAFFEYQTLICELTGMDVSNASLYEGASAMVEAVLMAMRVTQRRSKVVVLGSMGGQWMSVMHKLGNGDLWFWFGHQGYEYVDLGRFWAILLFAGLMIWLTLVGRALWPALKGRAENRGLIGMVFLSTVCIGLFFGAALTWGRHSPLSMIEYFRWWVVHLWVEGFFEVFATAVIALLFAGLGLVRARAANTAVIFSTLVFLTGGILGTLHHIYFSGTPTGVIAWGAMFSALEVVPLSILGVEAFHTYRMTKSAPWMETYKWPVLFFVAVSFWNLIGAGVLGFAINPPISLYYIQGLNMTPAHAHAALFGVYGMLGIGLMLFCLRTAYRANVWSERLLTTTFWTLNVGLAGMVFLSLVPAGIYQAYHSITTSFWYARSPEIIHGSVMQTLVWMRVPGDIVFSIGAVTLALFALRLLIPGRRGRIRIDPVFVPAA